MMLHRVVQPSGQVIYRSSTLAGVGVPHGFTTRIGPTAQRSAEFDLAISASQASSPNGQQGVERYGETQVLLGCPTHQLVWMNQVHGAAVHHANPATAGLHPDADAAVTATPGLMLSVRAADCVPILLASGDGGAVAAIHAGWRGVVGGAVAAGVRALRGLARPGARPDGIVAAIGPCIGPDAFEVGPEVADAFAAAGLVEAVLPSRPGWARPHVDLVEAVRRQLVSEGVAAAGIDAHDRCTFRDADEFFSYRREGAQAGRMAALIACRP